MRVNIDEFNSFFSQMFIDGSEVPGHIYAPIPLEWSLQCMIVEERVIRVCQEDISALLELRAYFLRQFSELLFKILMKVDDHLSASRYRSISFVSVNPGDIFRPALISASIFASFFSSFLLMRYDFSVWNTIRSSCANCRSPELTTIESGTPIFCATFRALSRTSLSTFTLMTVFI